MIVENDVTDRDLLIDVCTDAGIAYSSIVKVDTLEDAYPELNRRGIDLVILDLALNRSDDNPRPGIGLLERWEFETRRQKIPVIVVSRHANVLKPKALEAVFEVIPKPLNEGERTYFCRYLEHVVREAVSWRSQELTLWDRIRQQFNRVVSGPIPIEPAISVTGDVVIHPKSPTATAAVWLFAIAFQGLALYRIAIGLGWPVWRIMAAFGAVLVLFLIFRMRTGKQPRRFPNR